MSKTNLAREKRIKYFRMIIFLYYTLLCVIAMQQHVKLMDMCICSVYVFSSHDSNGQFNCTLHFLIPVCFIIVLHFTVKVHFVVHVILVISFIFYLYLIILFHNCCCAMRIPSMYSNNAI